ncbi:MAG: rubrerythrin family protein [Syntrophus sp. (in: bacteria)]|nr:rubrerythrin family protein [Syntrophus sp. (in: bacteria)]
MASLKGTKTEQNLLKSFAGESQARNRYNYFASQAKKEGYEQISFIFSDTADNEKEHAKRFFKFLEGGMLDITASFPAGAIGSTAENLAAAADGEHEEWSDLYLEFARIADEEGFSEIAGVWREIAEAETGHEIRYRKLLANVQEGKVFKKDAPVKWRCRNCGYISEGVEAPEKCPACDHEQAYQELFVENY